MRNGQCQFQKNTIFFGPQSPDTWLLFQIRVSRCHGTCFARNSDRFIKGWNVGFSHKLLIQIVIPVWHFSHGKSNKTALNACSNHNSKEVPGIGERYIGPTINTCHEKGWDTTKLGC